MEFWDSISTVLNDEYLPKLVRAAVVLGLGYVLGKGLSYVAVFVARKYTGAQGVMIARRVGYWLIMGAAIASAMSQLGFEIGVLLGAAGIITVALGFASQTSASNLISGLFLIGERPFVVGDVIKVGNTTGEVLSIDLLSVKLRTFDNVFVRVPNESLIKSEITNFTRFPIRRVDLKLGVSRKDDVARVREILMGVAEQNPLCLAEPAPLFIFLGFGDSSLDIQFSVWTLRENFLEVKNGLLESIKRAFDEQGIEIPYPQRDLHLVLPDHDAAARISAAATGTR
ncbi:MAG: mechanosensitive ion channel family protein [Thiohalomonadaceae bacterium]